MDDIWAVLEDVILQRPGYIDDSLIFQDPEGLAFEDIGGTREMSVENESKRGEAVVESPEAEEYIHKRDVDLIDTEADVRKLLGSNAAEKLNDMAEHFLYNKTKFIYKSCNEPVTWNVSESSENVRGNILHIFHRGPNNRVLQWGGQEGKFTKRNKEFVPWYNTNIKDKMTNGLNIWECNDTEWVLNDCWTSSTAKSPSQFEMKFMCEALGYLKVKRQPATGVGTRRFATAYVAAGIIIGSPFKCRNVRSRRTNQEIQNDRADKFHCAFENPKCPGRCRRKSDLDESILNLWSEKLALFYAIEPTIGNIKS
mmetsp:Transcript_1996/g.2560  ORF Transcript_1996/g.2560 Transcript_1996/m.2560 type:complete len:311 (-) Transcript_1996:291-1223(-)|eukprot:CAMPEP_0204823452 /NCGR_PEP_ID=MMETSP1346-20131115/1514_1 /ASSEMBLY_ACC=CAM_ASM_000771 /TAXON_ID=215587 /ORGANISM="Aplanochytrium stocchinoi, Strain GSBS06" /LENGTH=310 /DNA_ID=CAMNT_0051950091 /DNA_START=63 /DNA_END=995 /DNA_ORIENTATION=-